MIDTPMADAAAQRCIDTTSKWHGEWVPLEVARQLEHKLAEATGENTRLRAALASSKDPCAYCQLPKDEMSKCRSGFPGCARADDLMGCPELGAALEVDRLERELASVTKGLLELEEERDELDRELQDADRRANSLMRELTESKHRIRTLIEERDTARIQADHKWRLREEFEALLGTSDVATGVERVREAQKGAARYEYVRKLNSRQYAKLITDCMMCDLNFDAEVDRRRSEK